MLKMKKFPIQTTIGLLMLAAVIILLGAGYLSYRNISSIVSSIKVEERPELRLLSIRDISIDLEKAENSIRIYSVTKNEADLKPYYNIISDIDKKVEHLRSECLSDSVLLLQTDTISTLIEENIVIWNELLYLNRNDNVTGYLKQLSDRLVADADSARKNERGILRRVFSRNDRNRIDEEMLKSDIQLIEKQDSLAKKRIMIREAQLAGTGNDLRERFYDLISKMEIQIYDIIDLKAIEAGRLARETYFWLAMFSMSGILLAILVMFIIVRYVRKTYAYQIALENSGKEAEKLARTKELFMANMSHEIRTPVTAISGFTEQLMAESSDEKITGSLKIIKSSSDHLLKIIDDILDFSKLANEKVVLENLHFPIDQLLRDVYAMFVKQALRNNTVLSYSVSSDTPPVIIGDPYRLKQILINLVSNSVKFTRDGKVNIFVGSSKGDDDSVELLLEVSDTGIGIEKSKIDIVFQDFTQEEMSTSRKYGGTGLGLSIVKKLVDLHGGKIEISSQKDQGTKIKCIFPVKKGDVNLVKSNKDQLPVLPNQFLGLNVLVVDDEEYNRLLVKKMLTRWHISCTTAESGDEAVGLLKESKFSLVLMDMRMPGSDGLRSTMFIRNVLKISPDVMPVILFSAAPVTADKNDLEKAGINATLRKPFTEEMLLTILNDLFPARSIPAESSQGLTETDGNKHSDNINLQNLYHISAGNDLFVKQMLETFLSSTSRGLGEMNNAIAAGDNETAAGIAHKLLSPCRHIGAKRLFELLEKIERNITLNVISEPLHELASMSADEFRNVSKQIGIHLSNMSLDSGK